MNFGEKEDIEGSVSVALENAVKDAERTIRQADHVVGDVAKMIRGRLRSGNVSAHTLSALKKELRDWDMQTNCWKWDR